MRWLDRSLYFPVSNIWRGSRVLSDPKQKIGPTFRFNKKDNSSFNLLGHRLEE